MFSHFLDDKFWRIKNGLQTRQLSKKLWAWDTVAVWYKEPLRLKTSKMSHVWWKKRTFPAWNKERWRRPCKWRYKGSSAVLFYWFHHGYLLRGRAAAAVDLLLLTVEQKETPTEIAADLAYCKQCSLMKTIKQQHEKEQQPNRCFLPLFIRKVIALKSVAQQHHGGYRLDWRQSKAILLRTF